MTAPLSDAVVNRLTWELRNNPDGIVLADLTTDEAAFVAALVAGPLPSWLVRDSSDLGVRTQVAQTSPHVGKDANETAAESRAATRLAARLARRALIPNPPYSA